jgi:signal transduction histidine kinase
MRIPAPKVSSLSPPSPSDPLPRLRGVLDRGGLAWLALGCALLITLALWRYSSVEFETRSRDRFRSRAEQQLVALTSRMENYEQVLKGAAGLFAASGIVTRDEWRDYVAHLELDKSLPGIQATGYAAMVPGQFRAAHEAVVRADGFPHYTIYPPGNRPMYGVIVYIEPFADRNLRAFGFDMYSEPSRHEAMDRARDTGRAALSGKVTLVQETLRDVQSGFLMYLPVYRHDQPHATVAERRAALAGFVYSPFRATDLMQSVFKAQDIEVELYDTADTPTRENLLFESAHAERNSKYWRDMPVRIAGRAWTARFRSSELFENHAASQQPAITLVCGVALSLLLFALLYLDASHRRDLERQVRERTRDLTHARDEAEGASRAKTAFLATVSHELRTPLNAIIGFSSVLLQDSLSDEQRKQLVIVNRSGLQLLELIKEILDITSIEAGQLTITVEEVALATLLREQCDALHVQARETGLTLRLDASPELLMVRADRSRLRQVVRNLISNALKFTDEGGVVVRCLPFGKLARVEVEDTGIGIPPGQLATLFTPFQRANNPGARQRAGTGLGLAISRRLVEAMGGRIGVASHVGRGSLFWFTVPLAF